MVLERNTEHPGKQKMLLTNTFPKRTRSQKDTENKVRNKCGPWNSIIALPWASVRTENLNLLNKVVCTLKFEKHSWLRAVRSASKSSIATGEKNRHKQEKTQMTKEIKGDRTTSREF